MDNKRLYRAVGEIDDSLLLDAEAAWARGGVRRPVRTARWIAAAACFLLIAVGTAVGLRSAEPPVEPYVPAADSGTTLPSDGGKTSVPAETADPIKLFFNDVAAAPDGGAAAMICLGEDDFVPMTYAETLDYFGVKLPVEEALPDLALAGGGCFGEGFGVYRTAERGSYFDVNYFRFEDAAGSKTLNISLRTGFILAPSAQNIADGPERIVFTSVSGWELAIFRYTGEDGRTWCHTQFFQNGIAWSMAACGLTEEELARVLEALLEEKPAQTEPVTVTGTVSMVDARYGDFFDGQEHHYTEDHDYIEVELDGGGRLTVWLPGEADEYAKGDQVTVTYTGEPATIGHIWPGQLKSVGRTAD